MSRGLRLVLAAGGTGGHLFPGIAVAEAIQREAGAEVLFVGTANGMEKEIVPRLGFPLRLIPAEQLRGRDWRGMVRALWAALLGLRAAWRVMQEFAPDLIFSIGGYASGPTVLAGWIKRIPCVLLEPNAIPGLANRLLGRLAAKICLGFPRTAQFFPPHKAVYTGNPLRWNTAVFPGHPSPRSEDLTVLVFGGSTGARHLNQVVPHALALLQQGGKTCRLIHQTGKADHTEVSTTYAQLHLKADVVPFIENMQEMYVAADLVVCRAGAMTIAELTALGKPAILIPYPYAADDHQRANAEVLVQAGAARMILDAELTPGRLSQEVGLLLTDRLKLSVMAQASAALGRPDATAAVVRECLACVPQVRQPRQGERGR